MKAMLLAAGLGTRMRPLTDHTPKPLLPVAGKPLLAWHLERLAAAGFIDVVVNCAWLGEQVEAFVGDGSQFGLRAVISREELPLETGGGIFRALPLLGAEPFAVINSDVWTDYPLRRLRDIRPARAHLVLTDNPPQHPHGDFYLREDGLVSTEGEGTKLTWTGLRVLNPALFDGCKDGVFSIVPLLKDAMTAGLVTGEYYAGQWLDVGTPERLRDAEQMAQAAGAGSI